MPTMSLYRSSMVGTLSCLECVAKLNAFGTSAAGHERRFTCFAGGFLMAKDSLLQALWQRLEPLLPRRRRQNRHVQFAGRKPTDPRQVLAGILFVLRTGVPWRSLPATSDFPSGFTCWRRLRSWHRRGVWSRLLENLLAELQQHDKIDWTRAIV